MKTSLLIVGIFMATAAVAPAFGADIQLFPDASLGPLPYDGDYDTAAKVEQVLDYTQKACQAAPRNLKLHLSSNTLQTVSLTTQRIAAEILAPGLDIHTNIKTLACNVNLNIESADGKLVLSKTYIFAPAAAFRKSPADVEEMNSNNLKLTLHSFTKGGSMQLIVSTSDNEGGTVSPSSIEVYRFADNKATNVLALKSGQEDVLRYDVDGNRLIVTGSYDDGKSADCCRPTKTATFVYNSRRGVFHVAQNIPWDLQDFLSQIDSKFPKPPPPPEEYVLAGLLQENGVPMNKAFPLGKYAGRQACEKSMNNSQLTLMYNLAIVNKMGMGASLDYQCIPLSQWLAGLTSGD